MIGRRTVRCFLAALLVAATLTGAVHDDPAAAITRSGHRIAGFDRYQTAVDLSVAAFPEGATTAVIASGAAFPDGLAAGPLAALLGGPVLLTTPDGLPPQVGAELQRLGATEIVVVGGPAAVQDVVLEHITVATGHVPTRVFGDDRFATAAAVASRFTPGPSVVYVASGRTFPDALAGGAAAARADAPLLLVRPDAVPDAVAGALTRLATAEIRVLGGSSAVSDAVLTRLQGLAPAVRRIAGADRFATAAALAIDGGAAFAEALVTTGRTFPDALAASTLAAVRGAPILLTDVSCAPNTTVDTLRNAGWPDLTAIGGTTALSPFAASLVPCIPVADGLLAPGVTLTTQVLPGPVVVHILTLDRRQGYDLRVTTATGRLAGRIPVSDIARRWRALAAVNGGFFKSDGRPDHAFAENGRLLSYPGIGGTLVGFDPAKPGYGFFGRPQATVELELADDDTMPLATVNESVPAGEQIALLTPEADRQLPTGEWCRAVLSTAGAPALSGPTTLQPATVQSAECSTNPVPRVTDVLVAPPGTAAGGRIGELVQGEVVTVRWRLHTTDQGVLDAVGGSNALVFGGQVASDVIGGSGTLFTQRAPRTAIAQRASGDLLLVTVDGRRSGYSIGMTMRELADYLVGLGALDAANLDGGGSTAMAVHGVLVNRPSDSGGERAVGSGLVIVPRGTTTPGAVRSASAVGSDPRFDSASLGGFRSSSAR